MALFNAAIWKIQFPYAIFSLLVIPRSSRVQSRQFVACISIHLLVFFPIIIIIIIIIIISSSSSSSSKVVFQFIHSLIYWLLLLLIRVFHVSIS